MHTSHILRRRPFEPTSIVDWPKLASVNRNLPLIGCCARQSQRIHSHSFGCPFQWGGPKTLLSEKRLDKHYGNPHSNNVIGCDSELVFLFQSGLRNLQTHASNDHPHTIYEWSLLLIGHEGFCCPAPSEQSVRVYLSTWTPVTFIHHRCHTNESYFGKKKTGKLICCILAR